MSRATNFHIFSLPLELLDTLTPRNLLAQPDRTLTPEPVKPAETVQVLSGARSCNVCLGAVFTDVDDQRAHFRSDWHRYNVKARLGNAKVVSEAEFAILIEALEDSLSGSESSDDDEASESDTVQNLLAKTHIKSRSPSPTAVSNVPRTALIWFHSPPATQIGIYRAVLPHEAPQNSYLNELRVMQTPLPDGRKWTLFMVAGGHFAGIVVRVSRASEAEFDAPQKGKQKKPVPEMEILRHKTFHRYTTRRKQGGSQSVNDNAKGNAKSAGAQLRRYGEQALRDDIRGLIEEWSDDISTSERIWLRANSSNRRIFMDYDEAIIAKGDSRLRTFPFPTRRPTQSELSRCLLELTKVKVTYFTEEELQAQDEAFLASLPKPRPKPQTPAPSKPVEKKVEPKLNKEEEVHRDKWSRFLEMIKKGRLEAAKAFWDRDGASIGGVDAAIPEWTGEKAGTILQLASSFGQAEMTAWLLDDLHADPTILVLSNLPRVIEEAEASDSQDASSDPPAGTFISHKTAYDVASSRAVRDAFRRSAATRPDEWDWLGAGHIPSMLSAEREAERDSKKKERRKGLKDKICEREAKEREESRNDTPETHIPVPVKTSSGKPGSQKLGGGLAASEGLAGLTPEMRGRIERERRARAAEARLKALGSR
ncbi:hypothetical protein EW145_g250 [Phellinidium pouzarii]|uniref:VLRF1 domain-containing protein n=1 Tax=Phellinidium pouzarii TaxID=167371 RepID=A0A4S4LJ37_9AGAM|nr:hypothetical protein EW145_g250 [Phellinidium pouzarii]